MHAALVALRALPSGARHTIARWSGRRPPSALVALALAADGRRDSAMRALDDAARGASLREIGRLAAAAAALDAPQEATQLLEQLTAHDVRRSRLEALVAARAGDLTRAEVAARAAGWRAMGLHRLLAGERRTLTRQTHPPARAVVPSLPVHAGCILHLVTNSLPEVTAGYTVRTQGIVAAQRRAGMDAQVATRLGFPVTAGSVGASRLVHVDGVPYHRLLPLRWLPAPSDRHMTLDIDQTAKLVERLRPALLHAHSRHINAQVGLALRDRFHLPVVYEVRGFLEETWHSRGHDADTDVYRLARQTETRCMEQADAVVTLAESMKAEIVGRGIEADKVLVVPNAVGDVFLGKPVEPDPVRRRLGFGPDDVVAGLITTLNDYEGVDILLEAVGILHRQGAPVRLLVVGSGPTLGDLRVLAANLGLNRTAVFTGRVPFSDIRRYHAAIDVFCTPRLDTPVTRLVTPLKPLEAMASGRPVVVSDLPPLREIIDPGHTGLMAQAGDPGSLANAIALLSDAASRREMGRAARQWVASHRTWAMAACLYGDLYERLGARVGTGHAHH